MRSALISAGPPTSPHLPPLSLSYLALDEQPDLVLARGQTPTVVPAALALAWVAIIVVPSVSLHRLQTSP